MVIDATWFDPDELLQTSLPASEAMEAAARRWSEYGIPPSRDQERAGARIDSP
jgi:hypothetical protein